MKFVNLFRRAVRVAALGGLLSLVNAVPALAEAGTLGVVTDAWTAIIGGALCGWSIGVAIGSGGVLAPGAAIICALAMFVTADG